MTKKELNEIISNLESVANNHDYHDVVEPFDIDINEIIDYLKNSVPYELIRPLAEMGEDQWDGYPMDAVADKIEREGWKQK